MDYQAVCIFFAASWCYPCKAFLPKLIEFYQDVNIEDKKLEIIYASSDKSEAEFKEF